MEKAEGIVRYVMEGIFGRRGVRRASAEMSYQETPRDAVSCEDEPQAAGGPPYRPEPAGAARPRYPQAAGEKPQAEASGWTDWAEVVRDYEVRSASVREDGCCREEPFDGEGSLDIEGETEASPEPDCD